MERKEKCGTERILQVAANRKNNQWAGHATAAEERTNNKWLYL